MENIIKPWHCIPREQIDWHPQIDEELCTGCGMCVTGCGRKVCRFNYEKKKPVIFAPLNCMVACVTCANTCPQHAISFPSLSYVHRIMKEHHLIKESREKLSNSREQYEDKIYLMAKNRQKGCDGMGEAATVREEFRDVVDEMIKYCIEHDYLPVSTRADYDILAREITRNGNERIT